MQNNNILDTPLGNGQFIKNDTKTMLKGLNKLDFKIWILRSAISDFVFLCPTLTKVEIFFGFYWFVKQIWAKKIWFGP